jgi:hypothetical protein
MTALTWVFRLNRQVHQLVCVFRENWDDASPPVLLAAQMHAIDGADISHLFRLHDSVTQRTDIWTRSVFGNEFEDVLSNANLVPQIAHAQI